MREGGRTYRNGRGVHDQPQFRGRPKVLKIGLGYPGMTVSDYRSVLEEIEDDKGDLVHVNIEDVLEASPNEATTNPAEASEEASLKGALSEAFENGFEAGKADASRVLQAEYEKKMSDALKNLNGIIGDFAVESKKYGRDLEKAVVILSLAIARRVVAREINVDEGAVLARAKEAIRKIIGVDKIKIHVNPSDEDYIRESRQELSSYADSVKEISIEADEKVERGGCMIESELGNIDAKISTQFGIIEEALLNLVER